MDVQMDTEVCSVCGCFAPQTMSSGGMFEEDVNCVCKAVFQVVLPVFTSSVCFIQEMFGSHVQTAGAKCGSNTKQAHGKHTVENTLCKATTDEIQNGPRGTVKPLTKTNIGWDPMEPQISPEPILWEQVDTN